MAMVLRHVVLLSLIRWVFVGAAGRDTHSGVHEADWFIPADHVQEIQQFISSWAGEQVLDALDLFGQSEAIRHVWEERGFRAAALDIQFGDDHDILSRAGFFNWLSHLLKMKTGGIVVAGPPCSLWIFLSAGTHKRTSTRYGIYGDKSLLSVRISNQILQSFVALLKYTHEIRRLFYVIEQPVSSQMFRTPECQQLKEMLSLVTVSTWLGLFGHILMKSTKLLSNLPNHDRLKRKMTRARRQAIKRRQDNAKRRAQRRGQNMCFYRHDAAGRVTGGKDLASTSAYPKDFCVALFDLWAATLLAAAPASPGLASASEPEVVEIVEVFSSQN